MLRQLSGCLAGHTSTIIEVVGVFYNFILSEDFLVAIEARR
jgi:hypothetical protein